ncbi:lipoate--protein ligase family protein [Pusillimonas sp. TS35]|uniref:lipoyl protein ligase domain-containing protein n=1 Tax=Paracandidimonas lactea TaxID=2895524 RepID=UPI001370B263|nr:lipoate--protein ligase family protein [Paracandidimonas lactea]MYN11611.1 lipoate--protein ligase family protein [Pusillimonas sp. TS35]
MSFTLISTRTDTAPGPRADEHLIELTAAHGPCAAVWEAPQGLVVPRTYRRFEAFNTACAHAAARGWPVTVRLSGGGIVPQGPGVINVSLAYAVPGKPLDHSDYAYLLLCEIIRKALLPFGIDSHPAAVTGSFCDGRFNLAVGNNDDALRKVAGTAQLWRRLPGPPPRQVVLVHALVLADVDIAGVTSLANDFEAELGSERRYEPVRAASLLSLAVGDPNGAEFLAELKAALRRELRAATPGHTA